MSSSDSSDSSLAGSAAAAGAEAGAAAAAAGAAVTAKAEGSARKAFTWNRAGKCRKLHCERVFERRAFPHSGTMLHASAEINFLVSSLNNGFHATKRSLGCTSRHLNK